MISAKSVVTECPDAEVISQFVERTLDENSAAVVADHLTLCDKCARYAREMAQWELARQDAVSGIIPDGVHEAVQKAMADAKRRIEVEKWRSVMDAFRPRRDFLAAADGQSANQIQQKSAADSGFIYFYSHGLVDDKDPNGWRVRMARPPSEGVAMDEYRIRLHVEDLQGNPIPTGTLTFCGVALSVNRGIALMKLKDFLGNIQHEMISLRRESGDDVPGMLVFR